MHVYQPIRNSLTLAAPGLAAATAALGVVVITWANQLRQLVSDAITTALTGLGSAETGAAETPPSIRSLINGLESCGWLMLTLGLAYLALTLLSIYPQIQKPRHLSQSDLVEAIEVDADRIEQHIIRSAPESVTKRRRLESKHAALRDLAQRVKNGDLDPHEALALWRTVTPSKRRIQVDSQHLMNQPTTTKEFTE